MTIGERPFGSEEQEEPPRRSTLRLLVDRTFGPFFLGKLLSSTGIWVQNITAAVVVYTITRSAFWVGTVSVVQFAGPLLLSMYAGALTDRFDRRLLLMGGRAISGCAALGLSVYAFAGGIEAGGQVWPILLGTAMLGFGLGFSAPAQHALIPQLVRRSELEQAVALGTSTGNFARAVGPAIGSGLLFVAGPGWGFLFAGVSHLLYLSALAMVSPRVVDFDRSKGRKLGILGGVHYVRRERPMLFLLLAALGLAVGMDPIITLAPSMGDALVDSEVWAGALASSFGVGALVAVLLVGWFRDVLGLRRASMAACVILGSGLLVTALFETVVGAVIGFFVAGFGFLLGNACVSSRIQRRIPEELRGRIMALWAMAFLGSRPFGAAMNGSVAELVSVQAALLLSAVIVASSAFLAGVRFDRSGDRASPAT